MTWTEFKAAVRDHLHVHSVRAGIQPLIERKIKTGVIDLQRFIELYRTGHSTTYQSDDFTPVGEASVAPLPETAMPAEAEFMAVGNQCDRHPLKDYDFNNVRDLICGNLPVDGCRYWISFDRYGKTFYVFPAVTEGYQVVLTWDGLKADFADEDEVPFDEQMAEAVAEYVLITLSGEIDKNIQQREEHKVEYAAKRRALYIDALDRKRQRSRSTSEFPGTVCAPGESETETTIALTGSTGTASEEERRTAVANLINQMDPDAVILLGDVNMINGEPHLLQAQFIEPYYDWISSENLYTAFGDADVFTDTGTAILDLLVYATTERYYTVTRGPVTFFILDSSGDSPTLEGAQGEWLVAEIAACTSEWKIGITHKPPYCSDTELRPGDTTQRWLNTVGLDLLISGHAQNYERLLVDGFHYLVCGLGGAAVRNMTATPGSQFRYNAKPGALKLTATTTRLQCSLITTDFTAIDELILTQ